MIFFLIVYTYIVVGAEGRTLGIKSSSDWNQLDLYGEASPFMSDFYMLENSDIFDRTSCWLNGVCRSGYWCSPQGNCTSCYEKGFASTGLVNQTSFEGACTNRTPGEPGFGGENCFGRTASGSKLYGFLGCGPGQFQVDRKQCIGANLLTIYPFNCSVCQKCNETHPTSRWKRCEDTGESRCWTGSNYMEPTASPSQSPSESPSVSPTQQTTGPTSSPSVSPSLSPSVSPSISPSVSPSSSPSHSPSQSPNLSPSVSPSISPSMSPTDSPSMSPSTSPSSSPSPRPSTSPSVSPSHSPSHSPSSNPSFRPSASPSQSPSSSPSQSPSSSPSMSPSGSPSESPSTSPTVSPSSSPSQSPSKSRPTGSPSRSPTPSPTISPSQSPSASPSLIPSHSPSTSPSESPSESPSVSPSMSPSRSPTFSPSVSPSESPSASPSASPTGIPSVSPSTSPSDSPSQSPSHSPSATPTASPSTSPSSSPSVSPSTSPSMSPSHSPSARPTESPSISPSVSPSHSPSASPSMSPSTSPSVSPSSSPSVSPSVSPSSSPSVSPSSSPSARPTASPSQSPSHSPSTSPSTSPSVSPSLSPTASPSSSPSLSPSVSPSDSPSHSPSVSPTASPSQSPSQSPSFSPSIRPSLSPSTSPSKSPTSSPTRLFPCQLKCGTFVLHGWSGFNEGPFSCQTCKCQNGQLICTEEACIDDFQCQNKCCRAITAECLACSLNLSIEDYCKKHPFTAGCEKTCCTATIATCESCRLQQTIHEFCIQWPSYPGCDEVCFPEDCCWNSDNNWKWCFCRNKLECSQVSCTHGPERIDTCCPVVDCPQLNENCWFTHNPTRTDEGCLKFPCEKQCCFELQTCELCREKNCIWQIGQCRHTCRENLGECFQNNCPLIPDPSCLSYFDGCNICHKETPSSPPICTKKACMYPEEWRCLMSSPPPTTQYPTLSPTISPTAQYVQMKQYTFHLDDGHQIKDLVDDFIQVTDLRIEQIQQYEWQILISAWIPIKFESQIENKLSQLLPYEQVTKTEYSQPQPCINSCGKVVQHGMNSYDEGKNHCNQCLCIDGHSICNTKECSFQPCDACRLCEEIIDCDEMKWNNTKDEDGCLIHPCPTCGDPAETNSNYYIIATISSIGTIILLISIKAIRG